MNGYGAHGDQQGDEQEGEEQLVDFKGNPLSSQQSLPLGGWRAATLVLGCAAANNVGFSGIFCNLVLYLTNVWGRTNAAAANNVTTVEGTTFFFSFMGAFLSDAYLGRFWDCAIFLPLYFLGCASFSILVAVSGTRTWQWVCLNFSLYAAAVGNGASEPALSALGGDQLETLEEKGAFFNLYFVLCNVGQVVGLVVLSSLDYAGMWALGFGIGAVTVVIGLFLFFAGTPIFRQYRPRGNPLVRIAQVLVAAARKTKIDRSNSLASFSSQVPNGRVDRLDTTALLLDKASSSSQLIHTNRLRWLDKAAVKDGGPTGRWRICSIAQVEEVKCLVNIFPIWLACVVYYVIVAQVNTVFAEQGALMGQPSWTTIAPTSMQMCSVVTNIVFGIMYDVVITRLRKGEGLSQLRRMGAGLLAALVSMLIAGAVETIRLFFNTKDVQISLLWLVPQYVLVGVSQVLTVVAQMQFFYSQVSSSMRSLGSCLPLLARACGNYMSTILVAVLTSVTTRNGNPGWISPDLNQGHLNYFYWTVAGIATVDILIFLGLSRSYKYSNSCEETNDSHNLA